jgi:hypothetical protein
MVKVALGKFACFCIETRFGSDLHGGVRAALRFYVRSLESALTPIAVPAFYLHLDRAPGASAVEFDLAVEPEVETALVEEARRQAVGMQQLLTHAVFVYLADLDASPAPAPPS